MRIAIVAEHVRPFPWHPMRWAADLSLGLSARGHEVTLVCDDAEDHSALLRGPRPISIVARTPGRLARSRAPLAFQRWALARIARGFDGVISLSSLVPAGLWIDCDPSGARAFARAVASSSPATVALESLSRPWLGSALLAESRARPLASRDRAGVIRARFGRSREGIESLPYSSGLARVSEAPIVKAKETRRLRAVLGIEDRQRVLLASLVDATAGDLRDVLSALPRLRRAGGPTPVLVVLTREPYRVRRLSEGAGAGSRVRILGASTRIERLFALADAVVAVGGGRTGTGRFIADALAMETPAVCAAGASGSELVEPGELGTAPLGRVVQDLTPSGWAQAIEQLLEAGVLEQMGASARALGAMLSRDRLFERVERLLGA